MRRSQQVPMPVCQQVDINLDAEEQGLAQSWVVQVREELVRVLAGARSPEDVYRGAAKAGKRWLDRELATRHRSGAEIPKVRAFVITYFDGKDGRQGEQLAVINILTGRIER